MTTPARGPMTLSTLSTEGPRGLCPAHGAEWVAWSGYTLSPTSPQIVQVGTPTVARINAHRKFRFEEWRDTIRFHQDLIDRSCGGPTACHKVTGEAPDPARMTS